MAALLWLAVACAAVAVTGVQGETVILFKSDTFFKDRHVLRFGQGGDQLGKGSALFGSSPTAADEAWDWANKQFETMEALQKQLLPRCPFAKEADGGMQRPMDAPALLAHMAHARFGSRLLDLVRAQDAATFSTGVSDKAASSSLRVIIPIRSRLYIRLGPSSTSTVNVYSNVVDTYDTALPQLQEEETVSTDWQDAATERVQVHPPSRTFVSFDDIAAQRSAVVKDSMASSNQLNWDITHEDGQVDWSIIIFITLTVATTIVWASLLFMCCRMATLARRDCKAVVSIEEPLLKPFAQEGPAPPSTDKQALAKLASANTAESVEPQFVTIQYVPLPSSK